MIHKAAFIAVGVLGVATAFDGRAQSVTATPPAPEASASDDASLKALGEVAIKNLLLDPYSAVIVWAPQPFVHVTGITKGRSIFKRTVVAGDALVGCGTVNAKNRMGGYVGRVAFDVAVQNGVVVLTEMDSAEGDSVLLVADFCRDLGFGATPATAPVEPAPRVVFGAAFADVTPPIANMLGRPDLKGAVIFGVAPDSIASRGGLAQGDIITAFNGQSISGKIDLVNAVHATDHGKLVSVDLLRAGKPLSLQFQF